MLVIILKFMEVGSRAVFVVLTSYSLEIEQAGQFGLVVTLQGLASFSFGYERHIDVMRRMVGLSPEQFDRSVSKALSLFTLNYACGIPLLAVSLVLMVHLPMPLIVLSVVIAIAEQLMNAAYHLAMVEPRYRKMLVITVFKNAAIALSVIGGTFWYGLDLSFVLKSWALASVICMVFIAYSWVSMRQNQPDDETLREALARQYKASWTHFLLGLTAVLTIQIDRLLVGALLSLQEAGGYFRHVLLLSMLYQVFNIAFHNRILPKVFSQGHRGELAPLVRIVRREYWNVLAFWTLSAVAVFVLHYATGEFLAERYHVHIEYFIGLLAMSAIRTRADLNALVFNALHHERKLFRLQLISFVLSMPVMIALAYLYGIPGLIFASGVSAILYLTLTSLRLNRMNTVTLHAA